MLLQSVLVGGLLIGLSHAQSNSSSVTTTTPKSSPESTPGTSPPTWSVKSNNQTCVLLRGNFTFVVTSPLRDGNTVTDRVDIPPTASAQGKCGPFVNILTLAWSQGNLTFLFIKKPIYVAGNDTGMGSYSLNGIFGSVVTPNSFAANASGPSSYIVVRQTNFMDTPLPYSFSCASYESVLASKTGSSYLEMVDIQVQAFHEGMDEGFGENTICSKDTLTSVGPIIGYVLAGLAVTGGVGYLAWRKFGRGGYTQV